MSEVAKYGFTAREVFLMREAYIGGTGDAYSGGIEEWLSGIYFGLAEHARVLMLAEGYPVSVVVSGEGGSGEVPNAETLEAMEELEDGKFESFDTVEELFEELWEYNG